MTIRTLIALIASAALLTPAVAQTTTPSTEGNVPFLSGGVGEDSMAELTARQNEFNLKLFLVGQSGTYLSDIRVTIIDASGKGVLMTTSDGPVLMAKLPAGTYKVKAQKNGQSLEQKVTVTPGKLQTTYFRFPGE